MQRFDVDAKMEKFAVDLDAVLDEFEFHEDQVKIIKMQCSSFQKKIISRINRDQVYRLTLI